MLFLYKIPGYILLLFGGFCLSWGGLIIRQFDQDMSGVPTPNYGPSGMDDYDSWTARQNPPIILDAKVPS